jgi:hypothetical protein
MEREENQRSLSDSGEGANEFLPSGATIPPELRPGWKRPDDAEQARRAVPVLVAALRLIRLCGWCQRVMGDETGRWSLPGAIAQAGMSGIECEYARRQLRAVLWTDNLPGWNDHPARRLSEVTDVLRRAIASARRVGGMNRRGGWAVSR